MLIEGIKSRPHYNGVSVDPTAHRHLIFLDEGGVPVLLREAKRADKDFLKKSDILFLRKYTDEAAREAMLALEPDHFWEGYAMSGYLQRVNSALSQTAMSTRLYVIGSESFLSLVIQAIQSFGVNPETVQCELHGSLARRVQCVHCKTITENVTTNPFICSGCGLNLLVRDHYSRRWAAFQGVCIDAEERGSAPEPEVLFP